MRPAFRELYEKTMNGTVTDTDFEKFEGVMMEKMVEEVLRRVPQVIDHVTKQSFLLKKLSKEFYDKHKDLANHREMVTAVLEAEEGKNPGLNYEQLLEKVAPIARERLRQMPAPSPGNRPALDDLDKRFGDL